MLRPLTSGSKLLVGLASLHLSSYLGFPIILYICLGWCGWLWFVVPGWRSHLLATLGLGLTALSWWVGTSLWQYFARKVEGSHFSAEGTYWAGLATLTGQVGLGLSVAGILLLAYVDYQRVPKLKPKPNPDLSTEAEAEQSHVWPPAPKQLE